MTEGRDAKNRTQGARRGFVIAVVMVVAMLAIQLATSVSAAVLSSRDADAATRQLFGVVGDVTIERVGRYAQAADDAVGESVLELGRGDTLSNVDTVAASLYDRIHLSPQLGAIKVGWANGDFVELRRSADGYTLRVIRDAPSRVVEARRYNATFDLLDTAVESEDAPYDPRDRPWYRSAVAGGGTTWTEPYLLFGTSAPAVSASQAVSFGGKTVAVVAADLLLDQLAVVLDGLPVGSDGEAFVFDAKGTVVAAPGTYSARIAQIADEEGRLATRADLGISAAGTPSTDVTDYREQASYAVLDRPFPSEPPTGWVLHLRATRSGLAPSLSAWEKTVAWTTALSALVILAAIILIARVWRPLTGMRSRASTDALTGLANRHEFRSLGSRMVASAAADGAAISLMIIDLDLFKQINDHSGHAAGDDALSAVAAALLEGTRKRDLVSRMGGDEFVVIQRIEEETDEEARASVERLRATVAQRLAAAAPGVPGVGATAGFVIDREASHTLDDLMRLADHALIRGKRTAKGATYVAGAKD